MKWPWTKTPPVAQQPRELAAHRTHVMKRAMQPLSQQLKDPEFGVMYDAGRAFEPPLDPLSLVYLAEANEMHSSALDAKAIDSSGRGYSFEPKIGVEDPDPAELTVVTEIMKGLCPDYPITECIYQAAYEMDAIGWTGWEVLRDNSNKVVAIYPIPGHTLRATVDPGVWVQIRDARMVFFKRFGIERELNSQTGHWDDAVDESNRAAEMILFKHYSTRSSFYAIPKWIAALPTLSELAAIRTFRTSFFESAGVLDKLLAIMSREPVGDQIALIHELMADAGKNQHGSLAIELPEGATIEEIDLGKSIKEGRGPMKDQRNDLNLAVLIAHGVPPYRVGWPMTGSLAGNAAKEMLTAYRYGAVEPMQTSLEHRLGMTLFGPRGFNLQHHELVFEDLDWAETELNLKLAVESSRWGLASINESRRYLGMTAGEDPALDKHYYNGKVIDSSEDVLKTIDVLRDLREQFDRAFTEEQEAAVETAVDALAGDVQPGHGPDAAGNHGPPAGVPRPGHGPDAAAVDADLTPDRGALEQ